ncbi:MAG: hypothetical protein QXV38_03150 [Conexivisphaerales archaeon]
MANLLQFFSLDMEYDAMNSSTLCPQPERRTRPIGFRQQVVINIQDPQIGSLLFKNASFSYELGYSFSNGVQSQIMASTYNWMAPLADIRPGGPTVIPINSSFVELTLPVTFEDYSSVSMDFNISSATILNETVVSSQRVELIPTLGLNTVYFKFTTPALSGTPNSINLTVSTSSLTISGYWRWRVNKDMNKVILGTMEAVILALLLVMLHLLASKY